MLIWSRCRSCPETQQRGEDTQGLDTALMSEFIMSRYKTDVDAVSLSLATSYAPIASPIWQSGRLKTPSAPVQTEARNSALLKPQDIHVPCWNRGYTMHFPTLIVSQKRPDPPVSDFT